MKRGNGELDSSLESTYIIHLYTCVGLCIKSRGIGYWHERTAQHYRSICRPKKWHIHPCVFQALQQDEAIHCHHFLLLGPGS